MAPLLPGLSALPEQIASTARAAASHGACFIGANVLHLGPDVRDYFFAFLQQEYPDLLAVYRRLYGTKSPPTRYQTTVERRVSQAKAALGYAETRHHRVEPPPEPIQLALPLTS